MNNKEIDPLKDWEGDPKYAPKEDIFDKSKQLNIDPENIDSEKDIFDEEPNYDLDEGLDVPGAELDDDQEFIGEEDEENNYYSLGGDNHDDLEEDDEEDD